LRYGTLPLVRAVGGLADTVVNSSGQTRGDATANGFVFQQPNPAELLATVQRAVDCWHQKPVWQQMQHCAMGQDFSWQQSADRYLELYRSLID
jgi:starch synthase